MKFMGTKEAAKLWGYKQSTIAAMCREGLIPGAEQDHKGSPWRIPADTPNPKLQKIESNKKGD